MIASNARVALAVLALLPVACAEETPSGPCIGAEPVTVSLPFARLVSVSQEAQTDVELVVFRFDPSVAGDVTATAEKIDPGGFIEANVGEGVAPMGEEFISIRLDGLIGGAATDRIRVDPRDRYAIREVVQVRDEGRFRWIVGTLAGVCRRLTANGEAGLVVVAVTPS